MGLKTKNHKISESGITIADAYAQIEQIAVTEDGTCYVDFKIQQSRDAMQLSALERIHIECKVDKSGIIYEQAYNMAKKTVFEGWEDDIVEIEE